MKRSLELKLEQMFERFQEISRLLADVNVAANTEQFKNLSKEYAQLEPLVNCYTAYLQEFNNINDLNNLCNDNSDPELSLMITDELGLANDKLIILERELQLQLIPKDPDDNSNIYLEIRAGAGGDEAAIFAGDLFRMYSRYAETQGWIVEIISVSHGEHGGYKEIISHIMGKSVYAQLKFESGTHRVQRVPTTEAQGRVHTSTCTVAILPEVENIDEVVITADELRIDTYRASGAGGQHINKTDSAIRITHLPTGTVVECQDERSQHKNRAKAMALLKTRLLVAEQNKQRLEQAHTRKLLVGSGDRSERIRTYNFPQGRLTDHRINLTIYQLPDIIAGDLTAILAALQREYYAELLIELGRNN